MQVGNQEVWGNWARWGKPNQDRVGTITTNLHDTLIPTLYDQFTLQHVTGA